MEVRGQLMGLVLSDHNGLQELNSDHQARGKCLYLMSHLTNRTPSLDVSLRLM